MIYSVWVRYEITPVVPLSLGRLCHNMKKPTFSKRGEVVGWAACRKAAFQKIKETLSKDLER